MAWGTFRRGDIGPRHVLQCDLERFDIERDRAIARERQDHPTGAVRAQNADAIVYSDTAQASFVRSRIDPELRAQVEGVDGVTEVGGIGNVQLGARVPGNGPRDLASVALFGYELAPDGVPDAPAYGQAWADESIKADGVEEGMVIEVARSGFTALEK